MDYYNNDRYQWKLGKLSPNQFYEYTLTGIHPLLEKRMLHSHLSLTETDEVVRFSGNYFSLQYPPDKNGRFGLKNLRLFSPYFPPDT